MKPLVLVVVLSAIVLTLLVVVFGEWGLSLQTGCGAGSIEGMSSGAAAGSATSGKLFTMAKVRRWAGRRLFSDDDLSSLTVSRPNPPPTLPGVRLCENWAVITSINPPTTLMRQLVQEPEWCLVVVADRKSPSLDEWDLEQSSDTVYLTPDMQEQLPYTLKDKTPWNHFGRKNLGYLFAIHHGAKVIYDTDDDNDLQPKGQRVAELPVAQSSLILSARSPSIRSGVFNPYPFFGAPLAWPRGFPLDLIKAEVASMVHDGNAVASSAAVGVVQSLADHDPDVDGMYRLSPLPLPFYFSKGKDSLADEVLALPRGVMAPFNAQATTFFPACFWGLLLPVTVHGRVADIWRSYFTQRLMQDIGQHLAFGGSRVVQNRNAHSYLADFQSENPLYMRSGALVDHLQEWEGPPTAEGDMPMRMEALVIDMYEHNILQEGDVISMQAWITDLHALGYSFPPTT